VLVDGDVKNREAVTERAGYVEELVQDVERDERTRKWVGGLERLAQQRQQVGVGAGPARLHPLTLPLQLGQLLDELVDGQHPGERGAGDRHRGGLRRRDPRGEIELRGVQFAPSRRTPHGQRERRGQGTSQRLVRQVLVERSQRVALEQERLPAGLRLVQRVHRAVVLVVGHRRRLV